MQALRTGLAGSFLLTLCAPLAAQILNEQCGRVALSDDTGFSRQGGVGSDVAYDAIFPRDDFRGWGFDPTALGQHRIDGVRVILLDTDGSTPESVEIWVYPEDPANPGRPDFANASTGLVFSLFGAGAPGTAQAFIYDLPFPTPAFVPDTGDVFLEVYLANAPQVHVDLLYGDTIPARPFDIANARVSDTGHGLGVAGGYTFLYDFDLSQSFFLAAQMMITPLRQNQPGMALGTTTNQTTSLPGSTAPNMTPSFFSGLQPCATLNRLGGARTDDIGWFWNDGRYTTPGQTVTFMMGPGGFAAIPIPLELILPGSSGTVCMDASVPWAQVGTALTTAQGTASTRLVVPFGARATLVGLDFVFQGFLLSTVVEASACIKKQF